MNVAKLFTKGGAQAVCLPEEYRFDEDEVYINRVGDLVILYPRSKGWDLFAKGLAMFTDDCMDERGQPPPNRHRS